MESAVQWNERLDVPTGDQPSTPSISVSSSVSGIGIPGIHSPGTKTPPAAVFGSTLFAGAENPYFFKQTIWERHEKMENNLNICMYIYVCTWLCLCVCLFTINGHYTSHASYVYIIRTGGCWQTAVPTSHMSAWQCWRKCVWMNACVPLLQHAQTRCLSPPALQWARRLW